MTHPASSPHPSGSVVGRPLAVVTGAGGFIGGHLTESLLAKGYRVRALVHYNALGLRGHLDAAVASGRDAQTDWAREGRLEIVAGDIQDARCVRALVRGAEVVFHLAALIGIPYSYAAPESYVNVNIGGTLHVLEACRDFEVPRLIHTSTSEALGTARFTPQDEEHPLQAQSPYAASKIAADKLAESYHCSFGLPVVTLRPFNTYGPRQSLRAIVPTILAQALSDGCDAIRLGALAPVRDLSYVGDTVGAFLAAAEAPIDRVVGRLFHLGTGQGVAIGDLAREILTLLNCDKPIVCARERLRPKASEVLALVGDRHRFTEASGWTPRTGREEGLRRTADWVRLNLDRIRPEDYGV